MIDLTKPPESYKSEESNISKQLLNINSFSLLSRELFEKHCSIVKQSGKLYTLYSIIEKEKQRVKRMKSNQ